MTRRRKPGDGKIAVGYIRASTGRQKLGPEAQRAAILAWAKREGVTVAAWFNDLDVSGANEIKDRPGLIAALAALGRCDAGILVVAKRDRIARDAVVAGLIGRAVTAAGAELLSAAGEGNGSNAADKFMRGILDAASEYEREIIRERTRAALAAKSAKGERVGVVPFGFTLAADGVHLEPNAAERKIIATVRRMRAKGVSLRRIVEKLEVRGVTARSGKPLGLTQVARIAA